MEYKKTIFSEISNTIFFLFIMFLLSFLWSNFYFQNFKKALICSIFLTIIIALFYIPHKINKHIKQKEKSLSNKKDIYYKNQLLLSNNNIILDFIISLYNYNNIDKISDNHIITENSDIYICYKEDNLTNNEIYSFIKNSITENIKIFTFEKPKNIVFIKNKNISFVDYHEFISKCKKNNTYLDSKINIENKLKFSLKEILCIVLSKERSKSYLYLGLIILFSSLFTPYNIYYIIVSTLLFILSIFSKFNKIFN